MSTDELVERVRVLINEAENEGNISLLSVDTRSLDDSIKELLPQAVAFVQENKGRGAGRVNVRSIAAEDVSLEYDARGGARLQLPDDFVALVALRLNGWERSVNLLLPENSREAQWQYNSNTRGGCCRPAAIREQAPDGSRQAFLVPCSCSNTPQLECFVYEALFDAAKGLLNNDSAMADAVAYECAALLYTVFERADAAHLFHSLALAAYSGNSTRKDER